MNKANRLLLTLGIVAVALPALSQSPAGTKPTFEVAVVKPNASGDNRQEVRTQPGGRFVATGVPLKFLMTMAYRMPNYLISGGPDWINTDRWDIQAKAEDGSVPANDPDAVTLRLQSMMENQYQLKLHHETRELPVYELVISKGGAKIQLSADQTPVGPSIPGTPPSQPGQPPARGNLRTRGGLTSAAIEATAIPLATFVKTLSIAAGRTVVDKTALNGLYDIKMEWPRIPDGPESSAPEVTPETTGPSIFTVIQEQLGLRLTTARGPVEVIVIDGVQKPAPN